jgi:signal transduction histidine kinase
MKEANLESSKNNVTSIELYRLRRRVEEASSSLISFKEKVHELLSLLDHQVNSLSSAVETLIDLTLLKSRRVNLEISDFSLEDLFGEVKYTLQSQFSLSSFPVPIVTLEGNLYGTWDRARLIQVLVNLLVISIKEGNSIPVEMHIIGLPEKIRVSVSNKGIGLTKEEQEKIVIRFEKASNLSEVSSYSLGLFIAKQIIQAHGGMIWQHTTIESGSTIAFEIPRYTMLH